MSCIYKIEASKPLFSKTEEKIADYIIKYKKDVLDETTQSLADKIPTSAAAIVRFSKKLGYKGFSALKIDLAQDSTIEEPQNLLNIVDSNDDLTSIIKKTKIANQNVIENSYSMINEQTLEDVVEVLINARMIHLVGAGDSGIICADFKSKLLRIGYPATYESDPHTRLSAMSNTNEEDVMLVFSYTGETRNIVETVQFAKEKGTKIVGVTKVGRSSLQREADFVLPIPIEEQALHYGVLTSRTSNFIITDILFLRLAQENMLQTKERLIQSRTMKEKIL